MWAARSGCGRRSVGTCGLRLWIPRTCVGLSECPDPISIDCSKIPEAISAIAEDLCFADASSFSRTFRREFAHSPGEMRAATLAGLAPPATLRGPVPSAGADFGELLRGFHRSVLLAQLRTRPVPRNDRRDLSRFSPAIPATYLSGA
jgi:hypothetical protein